jgi:chemotaxis protein MotB
MAENAQKAIVVKKVKKGGHAGHHGGSWKVAYADFVTAMMAFFLLLWLLNVSKKDTLEGIARYFKNPNMVHAAGGASTSVIVLGKQVDAAKGEGENIRDSNLENRDSPAEEQAKQIEQQRLEEMKAEIENMIETTPSLNAFKDQLLLDFTSEGLRIQIVDKDKRPMFDLGSAEMKSYARMILREITKVLKKVPNKISISGHTDAYQYYSDEGYTNWELSSDRAQAARRVISEAGLSEEKIARVAGMSSKVLFDTKNPLNPMNRRISIIVLNRQAESALYKDEGVDDHASSTAELPAVTIQELQEAARGATIRRGVIAR